MEWNLVELYKPYEGSFCQVAVQNWDDPDKIFWNHGLVKRVDDDKGIYLETDKGLVTIPLKDIKKINRVGDANND